MNDLARRGLLAGATLAVTAPAVAQERFPSRPIRLISTFPPGGSSDVIGRILASRVEARLGQPVVIENRPGAGGNIGMEAVARAAPDGHTLGIGAAGALAVNPSLMPNMPYDPLRDLAPVTMLAGIPFVLAASPRLNVRSIAELREAARGRAQPMTVAHGGTGTAMHLSAELLKQAADLPLEPVPFRGSAPALTALLGGQTDLAVIDLTSMAGLQGQGNVVPLAVTTSARVRSMSGVPTIAEAGVAGYESVGWFGLVAPARTPAPVIAALNAAFTEALREPEVRARLEAIGTVAQPTTPEEFAAFIASETRKWAEVIRRANVRVE
ncbi:Bug family tripartite tricarboxylate transporter substrate binding protein [Roseomonas sp. CCTCC AB2023176]|uniref:Bug family tripartite tricarboxylate transporter substrate binding protein n=1 Tax=Roseomonas sp. CCTCC AB2023176 TaxID=3342640 RepID=UPI0035DACECF